MLEAFLKPIVGCILNILTLGWRNRLIADKELFHKLYEELPLNGNQAVLLREHDFNQAFHPEHLKPLNNVIADWPLPINEFHSWLVERRKKKFVSMLQVFLDELGQHTAMEASGLISIGANDQDMREKVISKIGKRLNKLSSKAYRDYESFIKSYKKELNA